MSDPTHRTKKPTTDDYDRLYPIVLAIRQALSGYCAVHGETNVEDVFNALVQALGSFAHALEVPDDMLALLVSANKRAAAHVEARLATQLVNGPAGGSA